MKILYFTDLHLRGKNSENRIGDYFINITDKFKEILSISKKLECDFIISGGDNFDSSQIALPIIDDFIDLIEHNNIPLYTVFGNHEEQNNSIELSKGTSLAHCFRRSKYINHLDEFEDKKVYIKGYDYYTGIEQDIKEKGLIINSKAKLKIAIIHAFITEKPFLPMVMHTQIKDIKTNYDIILTGHYHNGWNQKILEGVRWINPSCIGRLSINEIDIKPKVVFIDTKTEVIKFIELKNVKPKEEIFNLVKVQEKKEFESKINDFIESLKTKVLTDLDVQGMIVEIGKQNNNSKEVIDELLKRISMEK